VAAQEHQQLREERVEEEMLEEARCRGVDLFYYSP
jgi:hypothetical protein